MGLKGHIGTDTAWTFKSPPSYSDKVQRELKKQGWDGRMPLLGVAIINPFWWPVKPDILKSIKSFTNNIISKNHSDPLHYKFWMFHQYTEEDDKKMTHYLNSIANSVNKFIKRK